MRNYDSSEPNWSSREIKNFKAPCGNVIDGLIIRTATSSFDPSTKTPVCNTPLSRLNWMWRIDLLRLLMLNSQLQRSKMERRKQETQTLILQTDFNGFVGHINDIDLEWSVPNEKYTRAVMWCVTTGGKAAGRSAWVKHFSFRTVLTWEHFVLVIAPNA